MLVATENFKKLKSRDRHLYGLNEKQFFTLKAGGALIEEGLDPYPVTAVNEGLIESN